MTEERLLGGTLRVSTGSTPNADDKAMQELRGVQRPAHRGTQYVDNEKAKHVVNVHQHRTVRAVDGQITHNEPAPNNLGDDIGTRLGGPNTVHQDEFDTRPHDAIVGFRSKSGGHVPFHKLTENDIVTFAGIGQGGQPMDLTVRAAAEMGLLDLDHDGRVVRFATGTLDQVSKGMAEQEAQAEREQFGDNQDVNDLRAAIHANPDVLDGLDAVIDAELEGGEGPLAVDMSALAEGLERMGLSGSSAEGYAQAMHKAVSQELNAIGRQFGVFDTDESVFNFLDWTQANAQTANFKRSVRDFVLSGDKTEFRQLVMRFAKEQRGRG